MKIVLQRVLKGSVAVDGHIIGQIGHGYVLLVGFGANDNYEVADQMIQKVKKMRLFADANGKTNLSIIDVGGEILVISQFTLYADTRKGTRPSFIEAAPPKLAEELYDYFLMQTKSHFAKVESGKFGAYMQVELVNDGPFTITLEQGRFIKMHRR